MHVAHLVLGSAAPGGDIGCPTSFWVWVCDGSVFHKALIALGSPVRKFYTLLPRSPTCTVINSTLFSWPALLISHFASSHTTSCPYCDNLIRLRLTATHPQAKSLRPHISQTSSDDFSLLTALKVRLVAPIATETLSRHQHHRSTFSHRRCLLFVHAFVESHRRPLTNSLLAPFPTTVKLAQLALAHFYPSSPLGPGSWVYSGVNKKPP